MSADLIGSLHMTRLLFLLCLPLVLVLSSRAQPTSETTGVDSSTVSDHLTRVLDERVSITDRTTRAAERLSHLAENPLDVNRASAADLIALPPVSPTLARRIIKHRRRHGSFASLDALTQINGLTRADLRRLHPYLSVIPPTGDEGDRSPYQSPPPLDTMLTNLDLRILQRLTRDLDSGRGFQADTSRTTFRGSPTHASTRIRLSYRRRMQLAITLDKDPGEPLRWHPASNTYGFDHIAGNFTLRDMGRLQTLVIGDFTAQYGQGAALWEGFSFGKGRDPVSPLIRSGRGIVPFQSTTENQYFRGTAATVAVTPDVSATGFVSNRHRDATLDSSQAESPSRVLPAQTLSTGGLHRTPSEINRKGAIGLTTTGGALEYRTAALAVGITGYKSWFNRPLRPPKQPYRRFAVSGTQTSMVSLFASAVLENYTLFGEGARAASGRYGGLVGAALDHEAGVDAILLGRHFPRSFPGLYNSAIGESGATQNETGVYLGVRLQLAERWQIGAYADQYRFPWLRFGVPRPTDGLETRLVVEYDPRPWLSSSVQIRAEKEERGTERSARNGRLLAAVHAVRRHSARWHAEYDFSDALTLRTRAQLTRSVFENGSPATGILLYQGMRLQATDALQFDARLTVFDTDGFDARIYAYEHDLLYSFSVPVLHGQGQRSYILARYSPKSSVTVEAKYGVTWYPHRQVVGSGLNATNGNQRRELRVQLRWNF